MPESKKCEEDEDCKDVDKSHAPAKEQSKKVDEESDESFPASDPPANY